MAFRELKVVISKKSEKELKKAIDQISAQDADIEELKLGNISVDGVSVSVLKIKVSI
jgi:hypothetical protein|tara:strand:+ start:442 stop:612 length:171 start_codon:yes stop_codon:yes gene_type:complete